VTWLVLEIGHTLFLIFDLPHGALQFIFVLLALGFPMMLVAVCRAGWQIRCFHCSTHPKGSIIRCAGASIG
jgi:hypothetical protein